MIHERPCVHNGVVIFKGFTCCGHPHLNAWPNNGTLCVYFKTYGAFQNLYRKMCREKAQLVFSPIYRKISHIMHRGSNFLWRKPILCKSVFFLFFKISIKTRFIAAWSRQPPAPTASVEKNICVEPSNLSYSVIDCPDTLKLKGKFVSFARNTYFS